MLRIEAQWDPLLLLSEGTGSCLPGRAGGRGELQDSLQSVSDSAATPGRICFGFNLPTAWNVVPSGGEKQVSGEPKGDVGHPGGLLLLVDRAAKTGPGGT